MNKSYEYIKNNFKAGDIIYYQPTLSMYYEDITRGQWDKHHVEGKLVTICLKIDAITNSAIYFDYDWMCQSLKNGGLNYSLLRDNTKLNLYDGCNCYSELQWGTYDSVIDYTISSVTLLESKQEKLDTDFFIYNGDDCASAVKKQLQYEIDIMINTIHECEESYKALIKDQNKYLKFDFNKAIKDGDFQKCKGVIDIIIHYRKELRADNDKINQHKHQLCDLKKELDELK